VLAVDVASIQDYIFGSNTLRENVGASYLVAVATGEWSFKALEEALDGKASNVVRGVGIIDPNKHFEKGLAAEVLYAGGGKFIALFRDSDDAKRFGQTLSKRVLEQAPGLVLSMGHSPCDFDQGSLSQAVSDAIGDAAKRRKVAPKSAPLLGLGVTVACTSTGMPAVAMSDSLKDDEGNSDAPRPISAEVRAKWDVVQSPQPSLAQQALLDAVDGVMLGDFEFPLDFDNLGRSKGDTSYIGVVHADGNGIGKKFIKLSECYKEKIGATENRAYIKAVRELSNKVKDASKKALQDLVDSLIAKIEHRLNNKNENEYFISVGEGQADIILHKYKDGKYDLPFRPLIFGGDDLTFVCDGRLAVGLAAEYLRCFEKATADVFDENKPLYAAAGIAIVKTHYPFSRAYDLAEELCSTAKKVFRGQSISQLDWYIAQSGTYDKLEDMRKREYRANDGAELTARPFTVAHAATDKTSIHDWETMAHLLKEFGSGKWAEKRNKALALRDALREGKEAVDRFLTLFGGSLPTLNGISYKDPIGRGAYFDALELLDFYVQI